MCMCCKAYIKARRHLMHRNECIEPGAKHTVMNTNHNEHVEFRAAL
jgi:hypothetical protein